MKLFRREIRLPALSRRQWCALGITAAAVAGLMAGLWLVGRPVLALLGDPAAFRAWVEARGPWGRVAFVGLMALQIFVAVIPGEPLELGAGYAFGAWEGTMLCLAGAALGSVAVFALVRTLGVRVVELFFPREKIQQLSFLRTARRRDMLLFTVFCIPGAPKDILTYASGLTSISLGRWLLLTTPARIPSIITSTIGGDALGVGNLTFALAVLAVTVAISAGGLLLYRRICRRENAQAAAHPAGGLLEDEKVYK